MSAAATLAGAPPDLAPSWHSILWKKVWRTLRRLQARIVKASQAGRWNKVHALVYLLTHSFAGRAAAILRVTTNLLGELYCQKRLSRKLVSAAATFAFGRNWPAIQTKQGESASAVMPATVQFVARCPGS